MREKLCVGFAVVLAVMGLAFGEEGAATKPAGKLVLPTFSIGQVVEVKSGGLWVGAKIVNKDGDVYWVNYDKFKDRMFNEWVTVDRIRKPGETRDIPFVMPTPHGQKPGKEARLQALVNLGLAEPAKDSGNAAAEGTPGGGKAAGSTSAAPAALLAMDWSGVKEIGITESGEAYVADREAAGKLGANGLGLGPVQQTVRVAGLMATSVETGKIGVQYEDWAARSVPLRVQMADLKTGQANTVIPMPAGERALALSPDGKRVLTVLTQDNTTANGSIVDVGAISGNAVKSVTMFMPGANDDEAWREVTWGAFVDNDHVLVKERNGRVTLFSIPEEKAVYTVKEMTGVPGLSANRKYGAFPVKDGIAVVDAITGETAVGLRGQGSGAAFRSDGEELATFGWGRIQVFDVAKKEMRSDIFLPPKVMANNAEWVGPDYLLTGEGYLVNVAKGAIIWKYEVQGPEAETMLGGKLWVMHTQPVRTGRGQARALTPVTLPDAAALAMDGKLRVEDLMAVHPGIKVTLDVQMGNEEGNAAIAEHLTEKLKKNGMEVAEGQNIRLEARVTPDKSHEMVYQQVITFEKTKMTVNDMKVSVSFTMDGKEMWGWSVLSAAPFSVEYGKGKTLEQAVAEQQARTWRLAEEVELPKMLPMPRETPGFGESPLVPGAGKK